MVLSLGAVAWARTRPAQAAAGDPIARVRVDDGAVKRAMQDELARSMAELRLGDESKPYYVAYTISDLDQATVSATFGAITASHAYRARMLRTDLRVGEPSFDNSNFEGGRARRVAADRGRLRGPAPRAVAAHRRGLQGGDRDAGAQALGGRGAGGRRRGRGAVGDFSKEPPAHLEVPFPPAPPSPRRCATRRASCRRCSPSSPRSHRSRVSAAYAIVRRRMSSSEGACVDDHQRTVRIDVVAETQAADGMKLHSFVPFTALTPAGLPPLAEMEKAVRAMAEELAAMRKAPVASTGAGAVLFEGLAARADRQAAGRRPAGRHAAAQDRAGRQRRGNDQGALANKLGQKVASAIVGAVDDPMQAAGPGQGAPLRRLQDRRRGGSRRSACRSSSTAS